MSRFTSVEPIRPADLDVRTLATQLQTAGPEACVEFAERHRRVQPGCVEARLAGPNSVEAVWWSAHPLYDPDAFFLHDVGVEHLPTVIDGNRVQRGPSTD